jgi:hypothetical protein
VFVFTDRAYAKKCQGLSRLQNDCLSEFSHASLHVPLLEFELHVYNSIQNLGVNPKVTVPLVKMQGADTASRPVYPEYVHPDMRKFLETRGLNLDKLLAMTSS